MFQTAAGITIPFPEKLHEQYQREGDSLICNLSFEKLADFISAYYAMLQEPLFLAIHPDAEQEEVWYLDGMTFSIQHTSRPLRSAAAALWPDPYNTPDHRMGYFFRTTSRLRRTSRNRRTDRTGYDPSTVRNRHVPWLSVIPSSRCPSV